MEAGGRSRLAQRFAERSRAGWRRQAQGRHRVAAATGLFPSGHSTMTPRSFGAPEPEMSKPLAGRYAPCCRPRSRQPARPGLKRGRVGRAQRRMRKEPFPAELCRILPPNLPMARPPYPGLGQPSCHAAARSCPAGSRRRGSSRTPRRSTRVGLRRSGRPSLRKGVPYRRRRVAPYAGCRSAAAPAFEPSSRRGQCPVKKVSDRHCRAVRRGGRACRFPVADAGIGSGSRASHAGKGPMRSAGIAASAASGKFAGPHAMNGPGISAPACRYGRTGSRRYRACPVCSLQLAAIRRIGPIPSTPIPSPSAPGTSEAG